MQDHTITCECRDIIPKKQTSKINCMQFIGRLLKQNYVYVQYNIIQFVIINYNNINILFFKQQNTNSMIIIIVIKIIVAMIPTIIPTTAPSESDISSMRESHVITCTVQLIRCTYVCSNSTHMCVRT